MTPHSRRPGSVAAGAILIVVLTAMLLVPDVRHLERQAPAGSDQPGGPAS